MTNETIEMAVVATPSNAVQAAPSRSVTPVDLMRHALESGADLARLEKLMELQQRYEENEARKAYVADMAAFKMNPPQIVKDKLVGYKNKDGTVTGYTHATLGNVTGAIVEGLARHGFSHRWDTEQQGQQVIVTCILTHRMGHSERTTLTAGKDDSGKKNAIQQMASAVTYLQRYTLLAATGLATQDESDDDGEMGGSVDTSLADKWIADANSAKDGVVLANVWARGVAAIQEAGDRHAYDEFKAAVNARKKAMAPAKTEGAQ